MRQLQIIWQMVSTTLKLCYINLITLARMDSWTW